MARPDADQLCAEVQQAVLYAFGYISEKTGRSPTHLDMRLRFDTGETVAGECKPIREGGNGKVNVTVE